MPNQDFLWPDISNCRQWCHETKRTCITVEGNLYQQFIPRVWNTVTAYLDDIAAQSPDSLLITTTNTLNADPHPPNDYSKVLVTIVEATDNWFIFAKSLHAAQNFCLHMERFQFTYAWLTQWRKTYAYVLGDRDPARPERLSFLPVSLDPGVDPESLDSF
jgi:hypothetical protein